MEAVRPIPGLPLDEQRALRELVQEFAGRAFKLAVVQIQGVEARSSLLDALAAWAGSASVVDLDTLGSDNLWNELVPRVGESAVLVTTGLAGSAEDATRQARQLNVQRDLFVRDIHVPWVLLVPPAAARILQDTAPDFCDFVALWVREEDDTRVELPSTPTAPPLPPIPAVDTSTWHERLAEAWAHAAEGRLDEAADALGRYDVAGEPRSEERLVTEALIARLGGDYARAEAALGEAPEAARRHLAALRLDQGRYQEAVELLAADEGDPALRAEALAAVGDLGEAERVVEEAGRPAVPLARLRIRQGRYSEAVEALSDVEGAGPLVHKAVALLARGQIAEAEARSNAAAEHGSEWIRRAAQLALAQAAAARGQYDRAAVLLDTEATRWAGSGRPEVGHLQYWRAAVAYQLGRVGEARALTEALDAREGGTRDIDRAALESLWCAVLTHGYEFGVAEARLSRWIIESAEQPLAYELRGKVRMLARRDHAAELDFRQALTMQEAAGWPASSVAQTQARLASALTLQGDAVSAEGLLRSSLDRLYDTCGPRHWITLEVLEQLARLLLGTGRSAEAESLLRTVCEHRAARLDTVGHTQSLFVLGQALYASQKFEESRGVVEEAVEIARGRFGDDHALLGTMLGQLACLQEELGDLTSARATVAKALGIQRRALGENDPSTLEIRAYEAKLRMREGNHAGALAEAHAIDEALVDLLGERALQRLVPLRVQLQCAAVLGENTLRRGALRALCALVQRLPHDPTDFAGVVRDIAHASAQDPDILPDLRALLPHVDNPLERTVLLSAIGSAELRGGRAELAERPLREALDLARRATDKDLVPGAALMLATALMARGKFDQAVPLLRDAMASQDPALSGQASLGLAHALFALDEPAEAIQLLATPLPTDTVQPLLSRAFRLGKLGELDRANALFERALAMALAADPPDPALVAETRAAVLVARVRSRERVSHKEIKAVRAEVAAAISRDDPRRAALLQKLDELKR